MYVFLAVLTNFAALTMLVAGSLSLLRDPAKKMHQWFFFLTICLAIWMPANFFDSNVYGPITPYLLKVDYCFALILAWVLPQFIAALIRDGKLRSTHPKPYIVQRNLYLWVTVALNVSLIGLIIGDVLVKATVSANTLETTTGPLFYVYVATMAAYFTYSLIILGRAYLKASPPNRQGLDLIWIGFFIAIIANIATNLIFPNVISSRGVVKELNIIGYLGILLLVACVYVAITTKKLFDIRRVVARSLVYSLLLIFIGVTYSIIAIGLSVAVSGTHISKTLLVTNIILIFIAAQAFQYIRGFFTSLTSRIFFRDSYDPQQVLDELNGIITATLDLRLLTKSTVTLLERTMKSSFCTLVLARGNNYRDFSSSTSPKGLNEHSKNIEKLLKPHTPLVVDNIEHEATLRNALDKLQVELIEPLYANKSFIGYIAFGTKQNGVVYNQQDMQLLTLVADSLSVAVQNALRFEEIENFNRTLQDRVDDATKKLRRANEKLREMDETKDDFISMASHQLRTPLTSVKGYISMVLEGDAGKITHMQREMLGQAFFSSQRMVYLIADLLNVSRLKTGKFVIEPSPVDLAEMVEQELSQLEETAAAHSLTINYDKPKHFPLLMLDETKTRQVIMNFVDNAIYYTPTGGHITVHLLNNSNTVELRVQDNGIGVPKSEQAHLFTKFYRAANARKARPDGTGLGLFMAKKVIVAQGGSTVFESQEGKGSTFGFIFSKHKLMAKPAATHSSEVSTPKEPAATAK